MIGRSREFAAITAELASISNGGAALVVDGEAGIGKSTLLAAAAQWGVAHGYRRLSCAGIQSLSEVGFAGLHELIHPLLEHLPALPPRQRAALTTAFGLEEGPAPDRLLISLAVLGLLEEVASQRRLLLVIDDAQWLDQSSLDVLAFAARRLSNAPVMVLAAERSAIAGPMRHLEGLPRMHLGALASDDAELLLADSVSKLRAPSEVDSDTRLRVLEQAGGNPLAVIELTAALDERGSVAAGEPLPATRRVERAFLAQLDTLPDQSRRLLLLVAAGDATLAEIASTAPELGIDFEEHLVPLEHAGMVTTDGGKLQVRHPLIRSTVYGSATLTERAATHRALATATEDQTRSAWHLAAATFGPDETVAAQLETAAARALSRGASAEAAAALRRAAMLSPKEADQMRRLGEAAEAARRAGLTAAAIDILREAEPLFGQGDDARQLELTRFVLNATAAVPSPSASDFVASAMERNETGWRHPDFARHEMLWAAALQHRMHGLDEPQRQAIIAALDTLDDATRKPWTDVAWALIDDVGRGRRLRTEADVLFDDVGDDVVTLMSLGFAAEAVADRQTALRCWSEVQARSRQSGSPANECEGLRGAAQILLVDGSLGAASIAAESALRMAVDMNLSATAASAAAFLARASAWQGRFEDARHALQQARQHLVLNPTILWNDDIRWAAGLLALGAGSHAEAFGHLVQMSTHRTSQRWAIADLVETAVACGQADAVRPMLAAAEDQAVRLDAPLELMLVQRSRALLAEAPASADAHYLAALQAGETCGAALELARTKLLYGAWLRRRRRINDARPHLAAALATFDAAGAVPFTERAAGELRAAGVTPPTHSSGAPADAGLTPQELQIAQLAAAGMTNREIADRIYVSHRTVAAHLYKTFPKLGITSRSQLHAALNDLRPQRPEIVI